MASSAEFSPRTTNHYQTLMPEGDTIFRAARTLNEVLAGRTVSTFSSGFPAISSCEPCMDAELIRADTSVAGRRMVCSVYGRGDSPCRRCGTTIARRRGRDEARVTYSCPRCQVPKAAAKARTV